MAIDGLVHAGTESKWGWSEESTFGTVIADGGTFEQIESPIPSVNYGVTKKNTVLFDGSRVRKNTALYQSVHGNLRTISFSDWKVRWTDLGPLLYSVLQTVVEDATAGQFNKTYTINQNTGQPDFSANAGLFHTIAIYDTIAGYHRKFTSCILKTLTLTADLSGDGLLTASGEFISGFDFAATSTMSGTWSLETQNYFDYYSPTVKQVENADVVMYGWDITFNNNAVRVGSDSSGQAETYAIFTTDAGVDITGNWIVKYDSNVQSIIGAHTTGTTVELDLAVSTATNPGYFSMLVNEAVISDPVKDYTDERGQSLTIPFEASGTGTAFLATVCDNNDRAW